MKEKNIGSVFESEGLKQIAKALCRRLNSLPMGSSASDEVALSLDLSVLSKEAHAVLMTGPGKDPRKFPLFTILLVGLVTRILPRGKHTLCELGIDPAILEQEWIEELDVAVKHATSVLLIDGNYHQARLLSETGNKFLYEPLRWLPRNSRAEERPEPEAAAGHSSHLLRPPTRAVNHETVPGLVRAAQERKRPRAEASFRTVLAVIVISACVLIAAGLHFVRGESPFRTMQGQEMSTISPYLRSAQRDSGGQGALVVGTLKADWTQLSDKERYKTALRMTGSLSNKGVRRVMIYDGKQRLQIYFAEGIMIRPAQPSRLER